MIVKTLSPWGGSGPVSEALERTLPVGTAADEKTAIEHGMTADEYARVVGILGRTPMLTELGMYSVMWSEHCSYKSSRVHLQMLPSSGPAVLQGPGENAGAVDLGDGLAGVFKVESHNHPSYIEPYQGAATGVGGILRDIFTMGARPLALLDSLRFGEPQVGKNRHLLDGVVGGIAGYGNCMGIPTVGGEICFDASYDDNPLVNVMCFGVASTDRLVRARADGPGNLVIYVGARTGRDGIYGVSLLASATFDEKAEEKRPAVQVGDPFTEKLLMEACLELVDKDLLVGMQDLGGAGLTCSIAELSSNSRTGMRIDIAKVPRREAGLTPYEVMLSESQERMMLVVTSEQLEAVMAVFDKWDLDAVVIGRVTDDGFVQVFDDGELVADVPARSLAEEGPCYQRPFVVPEPPPPISAGELNCDLQVHDVLLQLLCDPTVASKRWVFQQYDQTVRFNTVQRPGGEAAVIWLKECGSDAAVALSIDGNPWFSALDARQGAMLAVAEACRNVACTGAKPLGITNCLNFGSPEVDIRMGEFAGAVEGMAEACLALEVPVTGGNVSFYNETAGRPILPTPVVGAVGRHDRYDRSVGAGFRSPGDSILLIGPAVLDDPGLGGSAYVRVIHAARPGAPPRIDLDLEARLQRLLVEAASKELLQSAKDCSDGGLAVVLAEACFAVADGDRADRDQASAGEGRVEGLLGAHVELAASPDGDHYAALFGEAPSRVVVTARPNEAARVVDLASTYEVPVRMLGEVTEEPKLRVVVQDSSVIELGVDLLYAAWAGALATLMERA